MEQSVVPGRRKHIAADDASPQKKMKVEREDSVEEEEEVDSTGEFSHPVPWQKIEAEGLDCDYAQLFSKKEADHLYKMLEEELVYVTGTTIKQTNYSQMFKKHSDCVYIHFRGRSQAAGVWEKARHTKKAGYVRRQRSDIYLLWSYTVSLCMDPDFGVHSGRCHKHNRTYI